MELRKSTKYSKDTNTVLAAFTNKEYYEKKYEQMGVKNLEFLEFGQEGDIFRITARRDVPIQLPRFATKVLGVATMATIVETAEWIMGNGDTKEGTYTGEFQGTPISINGEMILRPHGSGEGCEHAVNVIVVVKIPLVGKKIAKLLAGQLADSLDDDFAYNADNI